MGYTVSQINDILLKADKTVYKLGSVAYDNMFEAEKAMDAAYHNDSDPCSPRWNGEMDFNY